MDNRGVDATALARLPLSSGPEVFVPRFETREIPRPERGSPSMVRLLTIAA